MRKLLIFIICLSPAFMEAQDKFFDSLRNLIKVEKNDSEKVRLTLQLGNKIKHKDTAESWRCHKVIQAIATSTKNDYFQGQAYFLSGAINMANLNLSRDAMVAITDFEKAINIFLKYPKIKRVNLTLGSAYINLGLVHINNNDYETGTYYYLKAEEMYLKNDPAHKDLAILYSNLSIAYASINRFDEAIKYSRKGLDFARKTNDKANMLNALYAYGGTLISAKKAGDSGLAILDSAKLLATELLNPNMEYSCDFMKAMYYYNTKQYQKAIEYYNLCLNLARKLNFGPGIGNNFINIAANEAELKRPRLAAAHLDSSAKYLDYTQPTGSKQMYFENYAEVYRQLGNYEKAFAFKDTVAVIKDSLYQADNIRQMEFRQARYNYEKKQKEILQLENEKKVQALSLKEKKTLNTILIAGAAALLIILLLSYRTYTQKQKLHLQRINKLETQQQLTATEAVLKGEEQERTRLAKDLHDGLGGMLSGIKYSFNTMKGNLIMTPENSQAFERSMDMLDSSIKEMRRVAHNMMPEALVNFGLDTALKDFCNDINKSGALDVSYQSLGLEDTVIEQTTAITIYRIVQELLNNTMKHASAKTALVQVTKTNGRLSVTVEDDGKGFDTKILTQARGIGWSNIQNRVEFLKGSLDVQSGNDTGTSVHVEINL